MKQFKVGDRVSHTWCFSTEYVGSPKQDPILQSAELRHERGEIISILTRPALKITMDNERLVKYGLVT